jgi:DegV family protein with EDD domain
MQTARIACAQSCLQGEDRMQLVTDSAADLSPEQVAALDCHVMPLTLSLDGKVYQSGVDLQPAEFYALLESTDSFPSTSQPSAGDFAALYRKLAQDDPEILSVHISSGLSGTVNAARLGAELVPEARVTIFDSLTLSSPLGWMVEAAVRLIRAGWTVDAITERLTLIQARTQGYFTLNSLKYLVHGGRISHLKGLMASVLKIRPIIGPEKEHGVYLSFGQEITLSRALQRIPEIVARQFAPGSPLRVQLLHGQNLPAVEQLRLAMSSKFECSFDPIAVVSPALGAHTGPSIVGLAVGDPQVFAEPG